MSLNFTELYVKIEGYDVVINDNSHFILIDYLLEVEMKNTDLEDENLHNGPVYDVRIFKKSVSQNP